MPIAIAMMIQTGRKRSSTDSRTSTGVSVPPRPGRSGVLGNFLGVQLAHACRSSRFDVPTDQHASTSIDPTLAGVSPSVNIDNSECLASYSPHDFRDAALGSSCHRSRRVLRPPDP